MPNNNKIQFIKLFSLNGLSVLVKVLVGFVTSKFLAIFIGASGLAIIGNFRNFLSSVDILGTLGLHTGIVKFIAENENDDSRLKKIISTIFSVLLITSVSIGLILIVFSGFFLNKILAGQIEYNYLFILFALILPLYLGNLYLSSILTGFGNVQKVLIVGIIGNIITLFGSVFLIYNFKLFGALIASIFLPVSLFFINYYFVNQRIKIHEALSFKNFDFDFFKNLMHYVLMGIVTGLLGAIIPILIRNQIISHYNLQEAGYLEAMTRISTYYFMFLNSFVTIYHYPKLAKSLSIAEEKNIVFDFYRTGLPIFIAFLILIYLARDLIIQILFTKEFVPTRNLFFWQILGDVFKAISWILGMILLARQMTKQFVIIEISSFSILLVSSYLLIPLYGAEGAVMAHATCYILYTIILFLYFRKRIFS